ncbi:MAG TPA: DUF1223 domain-containing protein [Alphaproteobacteria bacterium]|jgi:hypothetical protein|nr:DUF1223 domain-containing protein [Alphaproteobacteria bacterium]
MHRIVLAALVLSSLAVPALAGGRPVVVELFTSQGCSSCPPADALLNELAGRQDVLALGFHVDYWDRLGWKDPLSTPGATMRQHDYAAAFGRNEVYTPQMVIDGTRQAVGSDRGAVLRAIADAQPVKAAPIAFAADGRSVSVGAGTGRGKVLVIRYLLKRTTEVQRGENAGRAAIDANGVDSIREAGEWTGQRLELPLDAAGVGHGLAILIQGRDGQILGAAVLPAGQS